MNEATSLSLPFLMFVYPQVQSSGMTASPTSIYCSLEHLFFPFEILFPHVFFIAKCTKEIIFFLLISFITKDNNNYFSACFTIFLKNIIVFFIMSHLKLNAKKILYVSLIGRNKILFFRMFSNYKKMIILHVFPLYGWK